MEEYKEECKEHNKDYAFFCKTCNIPVCCDCLSLHGEKGCTYPVTLAAYAKQELMPMYEKQMECLEEEKAPAVESFKKFASIAEPIKNNLVLLKERLEKISNGIVNAISLLQCQIQQSTEAHKSVKEKFKAECKELEELITKNDNEGILRKIKENGSLSVYKMGDVQEQLLIGIDSLIKSLLESQDIKSLTECLSALTSMLNEITPKDTSTLGKMGVYGLCHQRSNWTTLCKYVIETGELISLITVPCHCTVTKINDRIFLSGGRNPATNIVSEYIEETQRLTPKEPMKYKKYYHKSQVYSKDEFLVIGGYDSTYISYCEQYNVSSNKWSLAPSLKIARECSGTAYLRNKYIYAIGGYNSKSTIEQLNVEEMKEWIILKIKSNEIEFDTSPTAFPISDTEIIIICGGDTPYAGVYHTEEEIIKRTESNAISDRYYTNAPYIFEKDVYIIGDNHGNINIYNMVNKKFTYKRYNDITFNA